MPVTACGNTLSNGCVDMKPFRVFLVLVFVLGAHRSDSKPQQATDQIRVQTTLVHVPVMVSTKTGGAVPGLKPEDFTLYDDGTRQSLAFFVTAEEPIRVALLLDTSKSTTTALDRIRKAAAGFLLQLRPQDQAMVASFDSSIHILCRFDSGERELRRAIDRAQPSDYDGTKMCDAVLSVTDRYLRSVQGRKAIILLTDGQDIGSSISVEDMSRSAADAGVVIYPVFYDVDRREWAKKVLGISMPKGAAGKEAWKDVNDAAAVALRRVADETGGMFYRNESADFKKVFALVAEELRHQYLLAFYPDTARIDGSPHKLEVSVSRPGLVVRARRSYRASPAR